MKVMNTNPGNSFQPVLCDVQRFSVTGKSVVIRAYESSSSDSCSLPITKGHVMLQSTDVNGFMKQPVDPSTLTGSQRADLMQAPFVIAWVQQWLLDKLKEQGREITVMNPPAPDRGQPHGIR